MTAPYYPGTTITPNLGMSLIGMDEVLAENFVLIDAFAAGGGGGGTSVEINGSVVNTPNFNGSTPAAVAGTSNATWQVSGSNVSAYFTPQALNVRTAGSNAIPSPLYSPSEAPANLNPVLYVQDVNGAWHVQAGVDITTTSVANSGPQPPDGTLTWTRRMFFRDNLQATQGGKNAFQSINHVAGVGTSQFNQDRTLWLGMTNVTNSITSFSITSNVVTFGSVAHKFQVGQVIVPAGLSTGTYLNGVQLTVQSVSTNSLTASSGSFTHADVVTTADSGNLDQVLYSMTCLQAELDILGAPGTEAVIDGEFSTLSLQMSDAHVGAITSPNTGVNVIRAQYFKAQGAGPWGSTNPAVIRVLYTNNSAVSAAGQVMAGLFVSAGGGGTAVSASWSGISIASPPLAGDRFPTANIGLSIQDFGANASDYAIKVDGGQCSFGGNVKIIGNLTQIGGWPSQSANTVLAGPTSGGAAAATFRTLVGADIPNFIGDSGSGGTQGGVPAPASGDGAASKFLKADGTWATPSVPASSVAWDSITSAVGNMSLNNAGNTTTFNQTSAVNWKWANTTAATNVASQSSPIINIVGTYWTGAASAVDTWTVQNVVANGTNGLSQLTFAHSGSSGVASIVITAGNQAVSATGLAGLIFAGTNNVGLSATSAAVGVMGPNNANSAMSIQVLRMGRILVPAHVHSSPP
jgi:hypothetical protein